ncbi:MFS transporter [Amnibacterium sp. CER49]|uniref:MFS transporter n=1 Tax=Amnibacterium sp. CER49 TaxID=3039161 RepID=UPI002449881F|nr:MFS transporter [Amnibacterium sp. CER49]MDH2444174.1 MFS transporter [Amnibacterium sp. CER49]
MPEFALSSDGTPIAYDTVVVAGGGRRRGLLLTLCGAFFLDVLGSTSVFAASPAIGGAMRLDATALQWLFTAATLPGGAVLLVGGNLADRYGGRRTFLLGLAAFTLGSLGCAVTGSYAVLLACRVVQGVAAGVFVPASLAVLLATFTDGTERTKALAVWSTVSGVGATAGLLLGGVLSGVIGWRWVFLINVPGGLLLGLAAATLLPRTPRRGREPLDVAGLLTFTLGAAAVIDGLSEIPEQGLTAAPLATSGLGVASLVAFVLVERSTAAPALPFRLLRQPRVAGGLVALGAAGLTVDGLLFALTLLTQRQLGWNALGFAAAAAVMTVTSVGSSWLAGRLVPRLGAPALAAIGLLALGAAGVCFAATAMGAPTLLLAPGLVLFGVGMGPAYVGGSNASLLAVPPADAGAAGALQNIAFTAGSVVGVALYATGIAAASALPAALRYVPSFACGAVLMLIVAASLTLTTSRPGTRGSAAS